MDIKNIDLQDRNTQITLVMVLICAAAVIAYLYFVFIPKVMADIKITGRIDRMKNDIKSAKSWVSEKDVSTRRLAEYAQKIERYEKNLPVQQEIPSLLENLSSMARSANITIVSITPAPASLKDDKEAKGHVYQEMPIQMTAICGYHELGRFLSNLENADRFMKVVDIGIKTDKSSPKKHDVQLMIYTYILSPGQ